ncbi:MAG: tape measure protein, partial [Elusimicrobiaceae bacterium]|nr:tape measure protein [Elusimicrobiaceae bacterium]
MATIQASIKLHDGMTPALRSMQNALNIVVSSFESMQRTSGKAVNTKSIQAARAELSKSGAYLSKMEGDIKKNTNAQNKFNQSVKNGTNATNGLWTKIKSIAGVYLGFQAAKQVAGVAINTADQLTQTTARLNMINDGLQTTKELEEMIYQSAQRSRAGFMDTADAVAKLGLRAGDIFKNNAETIQFAETLNKMFVIAGASQAEMSAATLQLTQALGSGVLRGEEFNAVFEAAPNVMHAIAKAMNVPIGKLRDMAGEGKISAKIVKEALLNATKDVNEQFESMPLTWAQVWTSIKNYTIKATRPILDAISKITQSERFQGFINNVKVVMGVLAKMIGVVFTALQKVCAFIYDNWSIIEPILIAIAIVYLPTIIAGLWSAVTAVWSFVAGWLVANWPILLVVAAIALVIWALNYMGVTFGDVAGAAMWFFAAIHNGL